MSDLAHERVVPLLRGTFGRPYLYAAESASTQDALRDGDHPHGAVAVAEHQTAGRGRSGRRWEDVPSRGAALLGRARAAGAARYRNSRSSPGSQSPSRSNARRGARDAVKWPNDVLVDGGKVAGILLEASGRRVVCGIGINVNQEDGELPRETRIARRLRCGSPRDGRSTAAYCSRRCSTSSRAATRQWLADGLAGLAGELERRNALRGVRVRAGGRSGTAGPIAADGRLTVAVDDGSSLLVESGEVVVRVPG